MDPTATWSRRAPATQLRRLMLLAVVTCATSVALAIPSPGNNQLPLNHNLLENIPIATDHSFVWRDANGAYRFGVKAPDQWRVESRDVGGSVEGQYYYRTPDGGQVNMKYNSGAKGSRRSDNPDGLDADLLSWLQLTADRVGGAGQLFLSDSAPDSVVPLALEEGEELMPYGALKVAIEDMPTLRADDPNTRLYQDLDAIVTEIRPDA